MPDALVGVHVHAEPGRLLATLAALEAHAPGAEVVLLPDDPDAETAAALARLRDHEQLAPSRPGAGAPGCFNRLARRGTDAVVLLESGALAGPGAVQRLLGALDAGAGVAGPSTNRAWTPQALFPHAREEELGEVAAAAAATYADELRDAGPLLALADVCLAVSADVLAAVGAADEGFGRGPCWEMEYVARAWRAGFRTVWVPGAFVWRPPPTSRRAQEEAARFDASRRRYQDRLCGLRLRGVPGDHLPHCHGTACEHFAPRRLVRVHRPLAGAPAATSPPGPLVSCIMPTGGRTELALQAVRLFERQDHPDRELIVVDDGADGLAERLPQDPRVRYLRCPPGETIGAKRNRACAAARGELIAHWDDDDWYAEDRLRAQVEPIAAGRADITGLYAHAFLDVATWRCWRPDPPLHRRLFVNDVHNGTLVYRRSLWLAGARYPDVSLAEDLSFARTAVARGARLERVDRPGLFVYVRHGTNAWQLPVGDGPGWAEVPVPALPRDDRAFLRRRGPWPSVTCLMPTADRRPFVPAAIDCFRRQDHPDAELLILDDGDDRVADLVPDDARVRYVGLDERLVLGAKRNLGCDLARGEVIVHWDDDDWHAPHRVRYQVAELERSGADLCGPRRLLWLERGRRRAWRYEPPPGGRQWVAGNALCYRRSLWQRHPFAEVGVGEDTLFVWEGPSRPAVLDDHRFLVGLVHAGNTSPKPTEGVWWAPHPVEDVVALMGADAERY